MNQESGLVKIKEFTDLECWKSAHQLVLLVYSLSANFPKSEIFGLTSQMRRAAVSITSNIAEGFGRFSYKEKSNFYCLAQGSLSEIKNQSIICKDIGYISESDYAKVIDMISETYRLLHGFIRKTRQIINIQNS